MFRNIHPKPVGLQSLIAFAWGAVCLSNCYRPNTNAKADFDKAIRLRYECLCP
ncbi:hypothetical protein [Emticicia sp. W12TSBA100-4]|uniref:hypothetical protein n=1 Tax=Emticicia sp. W12TSBA100-4 TaxID=3160965 RepID=UPI0033066DB0